MEKALKLMPKQLLHLFLTIPTDIKTTNFQTVLDSAIQMLPKPL